jgi:hypothetical protein
MYVCITGRWGKERKDRCDGGDREAAIRSSNGPSPPTGQTPGDSVESSHGGAAAAAPAQLETSHVLSKTTGLSFGLHQGQHVAGPHGSFDVTTEDPAVVDQLNACLCDAAAGTRSTKNLQYYRLVSGLGESERETTGGRRARKRRNEAHEKLFPDTHINTLATATGGARR